MGKEYVKAVYYHLVYLPSMQSTSCKMPGWINHKLKSRFARRNINSLRYADDTTFMAESEEELKILLMKVEEESEKAGLKFNIQKTKIMASGPITSWQIDGETMETVRDFILGGAPKSLQMVTAVMKLKATCSWEGKMFAHGKKTIPNLDSVSKSRDITLLTKVPILKVWFFQ